MRHLSIVILLSIASLVISKAAASQLHLPAWIEKAVFYQIYPQSFQDSDGDGIGDIRGITQRLDYIKSVGCNTIWLNPCYHSAFMDAGYDVIDFYRVAPRYGTNDDLRNLFEEAHKRGMRVVLDLVAGHTSDQSPWFKYSQQKSSNAYSNRYIWTNDSTICPDRFVKGEFERNGTYRKNYFDCQPALNYGYGNPDPNNPWEEEVTAPGPTATKLELIHIMDYWMQMGCDGFRVDMAGSLVKNDPDLVGTTALWQEIRRYFQELYPEGILLAEWSNPQKALKVGFMMDFIIHFGRTGYRELIFNEVGTYRRDTCYFDIKGEGNAEKYIDNLYDCLNVAGNDGHLCIPTGNHDFQRIRCGRRDSKEEVLAALTFFLTQPGVPCVYYGDEIGMRFIDNLPNKEGSQLRSGNRAGSRTPMQWDGSVGAGFSSTSIENFYLPIDSLEDRPNVKSQEGDPNSTLNYVRKLLSLREEYPALACRGNIEFITKGDNPYPMIYERSVGDERIIVCINPTGRDIRTTREYDKPFNRVYPIVESLGGIKQKIRYSNRKLTVNTPALSVGIYKIEKR
ncbi:MAG: alpha-amylase family glycosyl hydrolase [Bacteroidales bacterium]